MIGCFLCAALRDFTHQTSGGCSTLPPPLADFRAADLALFEPGDSIRLFLADDFFRDDFCCKPDLTPQDDCSADLRPLDAATRLVEGRCFRTAASRSISMTMTRAASGACLNRADEPRPCAYRAETLPLRDGAGLRRLGSVKGNVIG